MSGKWDFWIDRGGTFTDVIGRDPPAPCIRASCCRKIRTPIATPPSRAFATCSACSAGEAVPAGRIGEIKMGTTVATNALLERKGDRVLLLITKGFRDALRIAYQARPDIFAKQIILPEQLYERVVEIDERVRADGTVEKAPDLAAAQRAIDEARRRRDRRRRHRLHACLEISRA